MKKINLLLCLLMAILFTTSCSDNSKMVALLEQIPESTDCVLVGNFEKIMESAGGSLNDNKINLPSKLLKAQTNDSLEDEVKEANTFLKKSGIDLTTCAMAGDYKDFHPVIIFALNDPKKFVDAIEDEGYKEKDSKDDVVFYTKTVYEYYDYEGERNSEYDDISYIAVKGSYAYYVSSVWVGSDFKPVKYIRNLIANAKEKNYASTNRGDFIVDGNAGGMAFSIPKELKRELKNAGISSELADIYEGTVCFRGDLSSNKATLDMKFFDEDDKEMSYERFKKFMDPAAKVNGDALKFFGKDEFFLAAVSMKDVNWETYTEMITSSIGLSRSGRANINAVMSYLERIDGTITFGIGLTNGLESIKKLTQGDDILSQFSFTLAVETKKGKAKKFIEDIKGFMEEAGVPFDESGAGFTLDLSQQLGSGKINAKVVDDFIVISNNTIKNDNKNPLVGKFDMTKYMSAVCIGLLKDNPLMKDLKLKNDVMLTAASLPKSVGGNLTFEIEGDSKTGIIEKTLDIICTIVKQADELDQMFDQRTYDDEYVYDSVYVDEMDSLVVDDDYYYYE